MTQIESEVMEGIAELFPRTSSSEWAQLKRGVFPWDSFRHIELISHFEDQFKIELSVDDAIEAEDIPSLLTVIQRRVEASHRKTK